MFKAFVSIALFTSLCIPYAIAAVVSLYIPENIGGDGVPITADPIGTDNTGHTTWRIAVGTPSGTFTSVGGAPTSAFATFVAGSTDVHAFANLDGSTTSLLEDCIIATPTASGGVPIASCVLQVADASTTDLFASGTETATPMPVQAADKTGGGSGSPMQTTSGGKATGTAASGSGAPAPTNSGKGNGAGRMSVLGIGTISVLVTNAFLSVVL